MDPNGTAVVFDPVHDVMASPGVEHIGLAVDIADAIPVVVVRCATRLLRRA